MSRTNKGKKGAGYEYWSRRSEHREPGRLSKMWTHREERRQGKAETIKRAIDELNSDKQMPDDKMFWSIYDSREIWG